MSHSALQRLVTSTLPDRRSCDDLVCPAFSPAQLEFIREYAIRQMDGLHPMKVADPAQFGMTAAYFQGMKAMAQVIEACLRKQSQYNA